MKIYHTTKPTEIIRSVTMELSQEEFENICGVFNCFFSSRVLAAEAIYTSYMTSLGVPNKEIEKSWDMAIKFWEAF